MGELSATATALSEVMEWKPATFRFKKRGIIPESETKLGFIANDLVVTSPECVREKVWKMGVMRTTLLTHILWMRQQ